MKNLPIRFITLVVLFASQTAVVGGPLDLRYRVLSDDEQWVECRSPEKMHLRVGPLDINAIKIKITDSAGGGLSSLARQIRGRYPVETRVELTVLCSVSNAVGTLDSCMLTVDLYDKDGFKVGNMFSAWEEIAPHVRQDIQFSAWFPRSVSHKVQRADAILMCLKWMQQH